MAERRVVAAERPLYNDEWLDIRIADMEIPDGRHRAHRSIRRRERDNARGLALRAQRGGQLLLVECSIVLFNAL